jgi:hypothetical protein
MTMKSRKIALVACACMAAGSAHADALSWDPGWGFSGFGTLGYTKTNTDEGQFVNAGQSGGVKKDGGIGTDSLLGGQLNGQANNVFSATVQALVQRNGKGSYQPQIEWAFLKAQVVPELSLRAGRMGLPFFMVSDYRHVNYSNLWVRPPVDVYGQVPVSNFNGGDATYRTNLGSAALTAQVFYGKTEAWVNGIHATDSDNLGVNLSVEFDYGITLRAGSAKGKIAFQNSPITGLAAGLSQTPFASVGTQLTGHDVSFSGIGASIDHENFVGNAEYTVRKTNFFVADTTGWEVTGGYRLGKFTPFVMVSKVKVDNANVANTIPASPAQLAMLHGIVDAILFSTNDNQHSKAVGLRWDVYKNIALKAQYDRIQVSPGAAGSFQKATAALSRNPVDVFAVSCDFLF